MTTPTTSTPPASDPTPAGGDAPGSVDGGVSISVATQAPDLSSSFGEYLRAWGKRIRTGESGVLPVVAGLIILVIIFQSKSSVFLSAGNLTNLLVQGSVFILLGMAEVWVLILGEIDLSIGYVAGIGGVVTAILASSPDNWPWWAAILAGVAVTAAFGVLWGTLVIRLRLPSFVVTLAGLLGCEGILLYLVNGHGTGGTIRLSTSVLLDLTNGNLSPAASWIVAVATVVALSPR